MSRQPQLPPRCPISKTKSLDPPSSVTWNDEKYHLRRQKSVSQSVDFDEQPAWFDDLLGDWDPGFKINTHRRAASDSETVSDGLVDLSSVKTEEEEDNGKNAAVTVLESACVYGPNSPRAKEKDSSKENAVVSFLSEYATHGPMQFVNSDVFVSGSVKESSDEVNLDDKPFKRHSAQRSRVRKLQYIAELERTVENFQNIVSELAVRVDSILEQRAYLSLENTQLKQQLARLQQEKFVMERQYQVMKNEAEGLKQRVALSRSSSKVKTQFRPISTGDKEKLHVEATWNMIDMGKLHIN
ncbi:uncharacterized protein [Rutidosis leptorrhynchoides]|uniref:uncharacterized protein n=1 Tax=Rutidosis leptorrhynchoides TaxID=125765 RepID=UPI003A99D1FE